MNSPHPGRRVTRIDELKRDLPPARDLWPAIAAAIEAGKASAAAPSRVSRRAAWRPAMGIAASLALVAIGVLIGRGMAPPASPTLAAGPAMQDLQFIPAALQRDTEYRQQRDALLVDVQAKLSTMQPAERDKVMSSLLTLQRSIAEIEAALGRDPANALLQELLVSSCQEEMRALTAVRDSGRQET